MTTTDLLAAGREQIDRLIREAGSRLPSSGLWPDDSPACCPEMASSLHLA